MSGLMTRGDSILAVHGGGVMFKPEAAQALISSTTAPPPTSSGRWKGQWTFSAKDLLD